MPNYTENENIIKSKKDGGGANEHGSEDFKHHVCDRIKLYEANIKGSALPTHQNTQTNSNNIHLVVPIGILIVLFTLYLTAAAFQSNYVNYKEQKSGKQEDESTALKEKQQAQEAAERIKILEKLLEYKDLCTELEIFTKDLRWLDELIIKEEHSKEHDFQKVEVSEDGSCTGDEGEQSETNTQGVIKADPHSKSRHRNVQRRLNKAASLKNKKVKSENSKNYSNSNSNKKDQPTAKKSNTAEPIIYLFALVFIYLLLKAASDINQHYKLQNKGDKRLRRCSLQSYAQTHKQDRRASKGSPKRKRNKELLMEVRSKSVDRFSETIAKKSKILTNLRKYTSLDEQNRLANLPYGSYGLIQPSIICKANNNKEISFKNKEPNVAKLASRRCSVPVQNLNTMPLVPATPNLNTRRTSIIGLHIGMGSHMNGIQFTDHEQGGQFHEVKRRVRMINRH